ncbi:hypothetical protein B0I72DRAFT_142460 [Yarrowia lipolytica]|jgi:hypothetical protein|uniref:YALI0E33561p n=2 Tax=Yarrowia lipolytica TaxID=4952 RepID=Q6C3M6_YARLI|nr:YALI0E33561p [Yarrowia lipolytica CLIB122]AOW06345.1 hypothetical protein YALI1_E39820g [Yarrowia lipolytica]KAB8282668.1 hypothetical protein BKA91DRAFT_138177 [Yarrowia lipolytica]KAE8171202.1 hypothetical protein BKA90DRAFT_139534 [Yarrowia lipolytica]KAJ8057716.1 hypothetical protein LXG23DRAFT_14808 [Yarrowia lipolytica]QNQ00902.1 Hypothetical protein YALI2_F00447g [Yarrowia lipolytica]|eukprot:XP_504736.2 YALI0E33561p [Yarrowia lipolytica CLIB122]
MEGDNKNENSCPGYPRPVSHGKFARPKSSGNNGTDIIGFCSIDTTDVVTLIPPLDFSGLKKIDTQWWSPLAYDCNANEADESLEDIVAKGDLAKYLVEVDRPKPSNPTPYDRDPVSDYPDTTDTPKVTPRRSTLQATR